MPPNRKLTDSDVREIRALTFRKQRVIDEIADLRERIKTLMSELRELQDVSIGQDYGVLKGVIYAIRAGLNYREIV